MFGRIGKVLLASLVMELGGAVVNAGRQWVERKLAPSKAPTDEARLKVD